MALLKKILGVLVVVLGIAVTGLGAKMFVDVFLMSSPIPAYFGCIIVIIIGLGFVIWGYQLLKS